MKVNINKSVYIKLLLAFSLIISLMLTTTPNETEAFTDQVIQHGAVGDDVIELQARLQYIGFYTGKIDGVFGWGTYWAVRNFQKEFGLKVDGLVGPKTKEALNRVTKYHEEYVKEQQRKGNNFTHYGGMDLNKQTDGGTKAKNRKETPNQNRTNQNRTTKQNNEPTPTEPTATNVPKGFSQNDIQLLAQAVYSEARGEPYEGQVAIAAVILNRLDSPTFPDSIAGVIFEPLAFTAVADGQFYMTPDDTAKRAVIDAINGWDPSGGAVYYFNPETATSSWIWSRPQIKRIGKHIFCK